MRFSSCRNPMSKTVERNDTTLQTGRRSTEGQRLNAACPVGGQVTGLDGTNTTRSVDGRVAVIRFRFGDRNTLNLARVTKLVEAAQTESADPEVRALVFASDTPGYFSDGYSLDEMLGRAMRKRLRDGDFGAYEQVIDAYRRLIRIPIPTVSFVEGVCRGAGLEWALCTDFIYTSSRASFCFH